MRFPLDQKIISGYTFGQPTFYSNFHLGTDYKAITGTPLYAPEEGTIISQFSSKQGGKTIWLWGNSSMCTYRFLHLQKFAQLPGKQVGEGDLIGYTDNTGLSSKPHLHLDITKPGFKVDPKKLDQFIDPEIFFKEEYMTEEQYQEIIWNVVNGWYLNYLKRQATPDEANIHVQAISQADPKKYALSNWINNQKNEQEFKNHWNAI